MTLQHVTVARGDARLAVSLRSADGHPTLMLLHGVTDGSASWGRVVDALGDRFSLVMADARGHGGSSRLDAPLDVETLVDDAVAVLEQVANGPALLWGHSMGAETAARVAVARPDLVRALVLEDPPFPDVPIEPAAEGDPYREAFVSLIRRFKEADPEERSAIALEANPAWHVDEREPWAAAKVAFDLSAMAILDGGLGGDWREAVAALSPPVLLVTGDPRRGAIVTPEGAAEVVALAADARVASIAGTGHSVHREALEDVLDAVVPFLEEHAGA